MSRTNCFLLPLATLAFFLCREVSAQTDEQLYLYGYSQTIFYRQTRKITVYKRPPFIPETITQKLQSDKYTTFSLQQLNLFLNKPFADRFNVFVNLEFQASYSSQRQSGAFNLQEGWVNYTHSDNLNLKVGLLLPIFNNLNEVQNRLPLFPYLYRPLVYESLFAGQVDFEDYLPEQAYLQVSGFVPFGGLRLDYAGHVGNSETSYLSKGEPGSGIIAVEPVAENLFRGEDLNNFKAYGGRIGVRSSNEKFKAGVSATYDHDNRRTTTTKSISRLPGFVVPALGDVPRLRLGGDLSFQVGRFAVEGEYLKVVHDVEYPLLPGLSLDKQFYYASLLYNFTDRTFAYTGYSHISNDTFETVAIDLPSPDTAGIIAPTVGGGYKLNDLLGIKWQYIHVRFGENPYMKVRSNWLFTGLSLVF